MPSKLREATPSDVAALAALHAETFRETHGGGPPMPVREAQWQRILSANDALDFTLLVEDDSHQLVGFARGTRHDGGVPGYQGELNKIYVLKRLQRHGLGRSLVCEVADRFLSQGVTSMLLFGDARSPSNGFYEHLGACATPVTGRDLPRRLRLARLGQANRSMWQVRSKKGQPNLVAPTAAATVGRDMVESAPKFFGHHPPEAQCLQASDPVRSIGKNS